LAPGEELKGLKWGFFAILALNQALQSLLNTKIMSGFFSFNVSEKNTHYPLNPK
jgi:hypothetical protein